MVFLHPKKIFCEKTKNWHSFVTFRNKKNGTIWWQKEFNLEKDRAIDTYYVCRYVEQITLEE
jgi:hypothetical protein